MLLKFPANSFRLTSSSKLWQDLYNLGLTQRPSETFFPLCSLCPKALGAYAARMRYALRARFALSGSYAVGEASRREGYTFFHDFA
ncbi:hypothetical protein NIES3585_37690 [Nodularia sp. NIES-3585]|nr:hypothetical protein NIES3585_37690 [Nodularia sp. NIES-3585]